MSLALFRLMGALGRNMIVANTFGSFAMLIVMALGGYIISRGETKSSYCFYLYLVKLHDKLMIHFLFSVLTDRIPSWWIWGFWISPLMYAQDAASVNEFLGHAWDKVFFYDAKYLKLVFNLHKLFTFLDIIVKKARICSVLQINLELTFEMNSY